MNDKLLTLLGFASKAGKLSFGMDMSVSSMKSGKSKLVIVCNGVSEKSKKEIFFYSEKFNVKAVNIDRDMATVSDAVGRRCGILSLNDPGFADSVYSVISSENAQ